MIDDHFHPRVETWRLISTHGATRGPIHSVVRSVTVELSPKKVVVMPRDVLIVNLAVLFAVLEADLGRRKVSTFRILRPVLLAAGLVPLFIVHPATAGNGEILEFVLAGLGVLLGVVAASGLMKVSFDDVSQKCLSSAGAAYAAFWVFIIGARLLFTYGANHWYTAPLSHWMITNGISLNALTDALIFMAVAMAVARSLRLAIGRNQARRQSDHDLAV